MSINTPRANIMMIMQVRDFVVECRRESETESRKERESAHERER